MVRTVPASVAIYITYNNLVEYALRQESCQIGTIQSHTTGSGQPFPIDIPNKAWTTRPQHLTDSIHEPYHGTQIQIINNRTQLHGTGNTALYIIGHQLVVDIPPNNRFPGVFRLMKGCMIDGIDAC